MRKKTLLFAGILSASLLLSGCACLKFEDKNHPEYTITGTKDSSEEAQNDSNNSSKQPSQEKTSPTPAPTPTKEPDVSITVSAVGDCTIGTDPKFNAYTNFNAVYHANQDDPSYFFQNVLPIFSSDDMTLVNFEGTLTTSENKVEKSFNFKGDPSYINILKDGSIEAVSFANNHGHDYGEEGFNDTVAQFNKEHIKYASGSKTAIFKVQGKKIGMVAVDGLEGIDLSEKYIADGINQLHEKNADIIIVSIHNGVEHTATLNDSQKILTHYAVDQGADLVIGHHPHVLQGIEKYKGVYIFYSLGNFCFGGNTNPTDKDTMIVQKKFTFHNGKLKKNNGIKIIPCSVSSVSYKNDYKPTPAEGSEKTRIIQKMNGYCAPFNLQISENGKIKTIEQ